MCILLHQKQLFLFQIPDKNLALHSATGHYRNAETYAGPKNQDGVTLSDTVTLPDAKARAVQGEVRDI